jgi:hypothetical protein
MPTSALLSRYRILTTRDYIVYYVCPYDDDNRVLPDIGVLAGSRRLACYPHRSSSLCYACLDIPIVACGGHSSVRSPSCGSRFRCDHRQAHADLTPGFLFVFRSTRVREISLGHSLFCRFALSLLHHVHDQDVSAQASEKTR